MRLSVLYMLVCFGTARGSRILFGDDHQLFEGSMCKTKHGAYGYCRLIHDCPHELHVVQYFPPDFRSQICTFNESQPVICCAEPSLRPSQRACDSRSRSSDSGIHADGKETLLGCHPHLVALGYRNNDGTIEWLCGGTLISQFYVMTAAHCVAHPFRKSPEVIRAGVHTLPAHDGQVVPVEELILHPLYDEESHYHDIALLKVKVTLDEQVKPACLTSALEDPELADVLGWITTEEDGTSPTTTIQSAELRSVPIDTCNNELYTGNSFVSGKLKTGIIGTQICAEGADDNVDSCQGYPGGPLQAKSIMYHSRGRDCSSQMNTEYVVFGVTSFGQTQFCGSIGVYTRVASYLDWIESIVWPDGIIETQDDYMTTKQNV